MHAKENAGTLLRCAIEVPTHKRNNSLLQGLPSLLQSRGAQRPRRCRYTRNFLASERLCTASTGDPRHFLLIAGTKLEFLVPGLPISTSARYMWLHGAGLCRCHQGTADHRTLCAAPLSDNNNQNKLCLKCLHSRNVVSHRTHPVDLCTDRLTGNARA
jgi:hypothetical protein